MTGSTGERGRRSPSDYEWWNNAIGRTIRTIWHVVGFYAAVVSPVERFTAVLVVGVPPSAGPIPLPVALSVSLAVGLAVLLSALRPAVSSARTLAFGFAGALSFALLLAVFGRPNVAGRPLVVLDVALAAGSALLLSAVVVYEFDPSDLHWEVSES